MMFGIPEAHLKRCSRTWADRIAYTDQWRSFKARNEKEWTQAIQLSCVFLIASLVISFRCTSFFYLIPHTSLIFALASTGSGCYLLNDSQNLGELSADATVYFQKHTRTVFGVQRIAIVNALPLGLFLWSFMLFV
ncbi:hypothetical protein BDV93DRAFT_216980 [Ceratobasidium sp. AG-I]|nr:hypothetical protein BDV93DRAFT_216980 [Ceratobasidium sp. AG-I]